MLTFLVLTAIRIEVPPLDAEKARHTPEDGFIVDKVEASVIQPGGKQSTIAFRFFVQDSETNLASCSIRSGAIRSEKAKADEIQSPAHSRPFPNFSGHAGSWVFPPRRCNWRAAAAFEVDLKQAQDID